MPTLTERRHNGGYLVSEANGYRSRDVVTLASNGTGPQELEAGTVLGRLTDGGKYAPYDPEAEDGSETAVAILFAGATVPASGDLKATATVRDAEVNGGELVFGAGVDDAGKAAARADLAAVGIVLR